MVHLVQNIAALCRVECRFDRTTRSVDHILSTIVVTGTVTLPSSSLRVGGLRPRAPSHLFVHGMTGFMNDCLLTGFTRFSVYGQLLSAGRVEACCGAGGGYGPRWRYLCL